MTRRGGEWEWKREMDFRSGANLTSRDLFIKSIWRMADWGIGMRWERTWAVGMHLMLLMLGMLGWGWAVEKGKLSAGGGKG